MRAIDNQPRPGACACCGRALIPGQRVTLVGFYGPGEHNPDYRHRACWERFRADLRAIRDKFLE